MFSRFIPFPPLEILPLKFVLKTVVCSTLTSEGRVPALRAEARGQPSGPSLPKGS